MLLVDPQLGVHGLGILAEALAADTWPAAKVPSITANSQAAWTLSEIKRSYAAKSPGLLADTVVTRAAGCSVSAQLLADGLVRRVLMIDPLNFMVHDPKMSAAHHADTQITWPPPAMPTEPPAHLKAWLAPEIRQGRMSEATYMALAQGMSSKAEVQEKLLEILPLAEEPRQPYDDAGWAPSLELDLALDWLATLRAISNPAATIWLSHNIHDQAPNAQSEHLKTALPTVQVVTQPWQEFDFLTNPAPLVSAIQAWLAQDIQPG